MMPFFLLDFNLLNILPALAKCPFDAVFLLDCNLTITCRHQSFNLSCNCSFVMIPMAYISRIVSI